MIPSASHKGTVEERRNLVGAVPTRYADVEVGRAG